MKKEYIIFIVEDEISVSTLISRRFASEGFKTKVAFTGKDALHTIFKLKNVILLLDYKLPDMSGKEFVKKLKKKMMDIPFIVMTGQGNEILAVEMMKQGAFDYIVKSIDFIELLPSVVTQLIEHIKMKEEIVSAREIIKNSKANIRLTEDKNHETSIPAINSDSVIVTENSKKQETISALLEASRSVLMFDSFEDAAEAIFKACKNLLGAKAGYVALLSVGEEKHERVLLDIGQYRNSIDSGVPMPIRGLKAEAYNSVKTVYENNYKESKYKELLPNGHIPIENVLFSPLILDGKAVGLLALANKVGGFTLSDCDSVDCFAEFVTIALQNSQRIKQLKENEKKLNELNCKLKEKNDELERFLYTTSHDLKSPLINIQGFSKEICRVMDELQNELENDIPNISIFKEKYRNILGNDCSNYFDFIFSSSKKMDSLIHGLLQLSRLGRTEVIKEKIIMNLFIAEIVKSFEYRIKHQNILLEIKDLPDCEADRVLLNQLFSNLIDNALKYMQPDREGKIIISGEHNIDQIIYHVQDNGIGISNENKTKIFEIFYQSNNKIEGDGLGLNYVRKICEMHCGTIWVDSQPGKGSVFHIALPGNTD